ETSVFKQQGFLTAGERNGEKIEGFDLGNSPFEFMAADCKDKSIVMTTTNGTQAIHRSKTAQHVFIGSFLNLSAVAEKILQLPVNGVVVHCAGWKNRFSMEDTLFAGALLEKLDTYASVECDAGLAALTLYKTVKNTLLDFVMKSSHAKRLEKLHHHLEKDIAFCLQTDVFDNVPYLKKEEGYLTN
ncbi:MAG: 2-phosphosulfolactate phosphatase, partial [Flammeovirgaceae bacterium]|nr:2-phosphosulfolactate phosphatase [Flammeovirgaceae bacterium]MDW8288797.1 2-phosphosulfolactate phosphatase [Flammeovirgaceae bacterium]